MDVIDSLPKPSEFEIGQQVRRLIGSYFDGTFDVNRLISKLQGLQQEFVDSRGLRLEALPEGIEKLQALAATDLGRGYVWDMQVADCFWTLLGATPESLIARESRQLADGERFRCPCCDCFTLTEQPPGTYEICDVCNWEDDYVQFTDVDYWGGANDVSLKDARENYRRFGRSDPNRTGNDVRPPTPDEL